MEQMFIFLGLAILSNLIVTIGLSLFTQYQVRKIAEHERALLHAEITQNREAVVEAMMATKSGQSSESNN